MSTSNLSSKSAGAGMFAAIVASLCCITPVFSVLAGIGGIAATFSWMEPFRPYLIVMTIGILGFAWYQKFLPAGRHGKTKAIGEIDCDCEEEKASFWQTKKFLGIVTVFAALMLVFPSYSHIFYSNNNNSSIMIAQDSTQTALLTLNIKGMTCGGCESHIVHEVNKLNGIKSVKASYAEGSASVEFVLSKVNREDIITAINNTGYTVIEGELETATSLTTNSNISFYQVPLVCKAAPTIGCGSRSKPILKDFEKSNLVKEACLNRTGTVVAVVWNENDNYKERRKLSNEIFDRHKLKASELKVDDYASSMDSFSKGEGWYKGADVDKLSKEEAGIIADQLMIPIMEKTKMNAANRQKMKDKMVNRIYDFFLNYKYINELGDPKIYKAMITEFIEYGETIVGKGNMPTDDQLWNACSNASKSCNHQSCSSSCSSKKS